jgi:hypothetical protein
MKYDMKVKRMSFRTDMLESDFCGLRDIDDKWFKTLSCDIIKETSYEKDPMTKKNLRPQTREYALVNIKHIHGINRSISYDVEVILYPLLVGQDMDPQVQIHLTVSHWRGGINVGQFRKKDLRVSKYAMTSLKELLFQEIKELSRSLD